MMRSSSMACSRSFRLPRHKLGPDFSALRGAIHLTRSLPRGPPDGQHHPIRTGSTLSRNPSHFLAAFKLSTPSFIPYKDEALNAQRHVACFACALEPCLSVGLLSQASGIFQQHGELYLTPSNTRGCTVCLRRGEIRRGILTFCKTAVESLRVSID